MRDGRPNVEDDIKNDLFPDPPVGAHPKFRCGICSRAWPCLARLACSTCSRCRAHIWFLRPQTMQYRSNMLRERARLSIGAGRLLCAGVWMGRAGAVRHYLSRYFLAAGHVDGRAWDDQGCAPRPVLTCASLAALVSGTANLQTAVSDGAACVGGRWWRNLFLAQVYAPAAQARQDPLLAIDYHGRLFQARLAPGCACQGLCGRSVPGSAC